MPVQVPVAVLVNVIVIKCEGCEVFVIVSPLG